jgi:hypothetical protein
VVPGYKSRDLGSILSFLEGVCLEWGPLSFVSTAEELLRRKSSGSGLGSREYGRRNPSRWPRGTLYRRKAALTSPTGGGLYSLPVDSGHGVYFIYIWPDAISRWIQQRNSIKFCSNFGKRAMEAWQWLDKCSGKETWAVHEKSKTTETEKCETGEEQRQEQCSPFSLAYSGLFTRNSS